MFFFFFFVKHDTAPADTFFSRNPLDYIHII